MTSRLKSFYHNYRAFTVLFTLDREIAPTVIALLLTLARIYICNYDTHVMLVTNYKTYVCFDNINVHYRDNERKIVVNNVDRSSLRAP